jgi:hypothetical protein
MSQTTITKRLRKSSKKPLLTLVVDERTDDLSDEALYCRSWGHRWELRPLSGARFQELLSKGLTESFRYCDNGCGSEWIELYDVETFEVRQTIRKYPKKSDHSNYLITPGSGRLPRREARKANFARQHRELVATR